MNIRNIRPSPRLRRTPQTTQISPSSRSLTTAAATASSTSWDSAHWVVGTLPPPSSSATISSQGKHSPLSNTGAFAGVIVGVSVSCLIIIGFLIYKIKHPKLKPHTLSEKHSAHFSGPITPPPQAASPANAPERDHPPDHTSSNPFSSLRRSSRRRSVNRPAGNSNDSSHSGPLFTPPGTPSDRNRSPFDIFTSGSSGHGRGARASIGAASVATSQAVSVPRPLPFPPHSPPPYSSKRASHQPSSSRNHSNATSPLSSVFPSDEKHRSHRTSDGISRVGQPQAFTVEYPIRSTPPSTDDNPGAEGLQSPFRDPNRAASSSTLAPALRDSTMSSSTEMEHGNAPPSSWRSALSPVLPRPTSVVSDPFNNRGFELPSWLDADPYSRSEQRAHATTSIYSVAQRSVAASSKILPSDNSLRTLTPEPSEDNHNATLHVAVLARFRTTSLGQGNDAEGALPGENVEGDGPESYAVRISDGAQRRGWGTEDKQQPPRRGGRRVSSSGRPRLLHLNHRASEVVHPAPASSSPTSPSTGVPLSAEFEARGLGRSFIQSLISKVRWSSTTATENSRLLRTPQEATRAPEGLPAWLRGDPFEMPRASMGAASSKLLPSEVGHGDASSIRSISAETGWIEPHPESSNMQSSSKPVSEPVDGYEAVDVPQGAINQTQGSSVAPRAQEPSQSQSQSRASSPVLPPLS